MSYDGNDALVVPAESVTIRDGRSYVLKLVGPPDATPRVSQRSVAVGRRQGDQLEIVSGIERDDLVTEVVRGDRFRLVRVDDQGAAPQRARVQIRRPSQTRQWPWNRRALTNPLN